MQVVELDFLYPSEGIHRRWESGYRITSTAATPDQAAFILSIPKRKLMDETQETLRTSTFPSNHVKVTSCYELLPVRIANLTLGFINMFAFQMALARSSLVYKRMLSCRP
ncbi:hypothetical protein BHE74_00028263 [Ensete ventricosum]|nr:hypothetical protein GW17_00012468 [Ensete ventricosum]RWW64499.1 hypothetical protein BHE74_00028263 [Ensete ventricosum]RZR87587.1 hypothetical protein BHM03_00015044 [Ensete ventricosum]